MVAKRKSPKPVRKLIAFDPETWQALILLSRDSKRSFQDLAAEAFADLLKKYGRPASLKEALRMSARQQPANDPAPAGSGIRRKR